MVRKLYTCLLLMHPPVFRRRCKPEMLCIFDEAVASSGALSLILDGVVSLARQWILRSGSSLVALAILGACLQISAGGLIWLAIGQVSDTSKTLPDAAALDELMRFILASVGGIVVMVTATSLWMRSFVRTRSRDVRLAR